MSELDEDFSKETAFEITGNLGNDDANVVAPGDGLDDIVVPETLENANVVAPGDDLDAICLTSNPGGGGDGGDHDPENNPLDKRIDELAKEIAGKRAIHTAGLGGIIDMTTPDDAARGAEGMKDYYETQIEPLQKELIEVQDERQNQIYDGMISQIQSEIDATDIPEKKAHLSELQENLRNKKKY